MDAHKIYIDSLCRICGNVIKAKIRKPKFVLVYCSVINRLFNYDITQDDDNCFPQYVCDSCRRMLDRAKKDISLSVAEGNLATFIPHSDSFVCLDVNTIYQRRMERTKCSTLAQKTSSLEIFAATAHKKGLITVYSSCDNMYFAQVDLNEDGETVLDKTLNVTSNGH